MRRKRKRKYKRCEVEEDIWQFDLANGCNITATSGCRCLQGDGLLLVDVGHYYQWNFRF